MLLSLYHIPLHPPSTVHHNASHPCSSFKPFVPTSVSLSSTTAPSLATTTSSPSFDVRFRLASDAVSLPLALNAHVNRSDFDPDFVATLLSRQSHHNVVDVILHTGCTFSISPDHRDFVTYEASNADQVQTVDGSTAVAGTGIVCWALISEDVQQMDLFLPCHHVSASTVRLLSPQDFCQHNGFDRSQDQFGGNFFGCTPITNGLASSVLSILAPTSPSLLPKLLAIRGDAALTRIPIRTPEHHRVHHANATALSASPFSKKPIRISPQFNRIYSFGTFVNVILFFASSTPNASSDS